jgi:hypothetical protein
MHADKQERGRCLETGHYQMSNNQTDWMMRTGHGNLQTKLTEASKMQGNSGSGESWSLASREASNALAEPDKQSAITNLG